MNTITVNCETKKKDVNVLIPLYGWANPFSKTWYITKNKKQILPYGSILLFEIYGKPTSLGIKIKTTYPTVGDIVSDIDNKKYLVEKVMWHDK